MAPRNVPTSFEISGPWTFLDASQDSPTTFAQPDFDDSNWDVDPHVSRPVTQVRRFRTQLKTAASAQGRRNWLTFDGVCSDAHVWIDGTYLGDVDGLILPTAFDITDAVLARDEHVIALQIPEGADVSEFAPVQVCETGPVRISRLRALCTDASEEQATVTFSAELDARSATDAGVRTTIGELDNEFSRGLAAGRNRLRWTIQVERPKLWWPRDFGEPVLTDVSVQIVDPRHPNRVSDLKHFKIGFRDVEVRRGVLRVNGERALLRAGAANDFESSAGVNAVLCEDPRSTPKILDSADQNGVIALHPVFEQTKQVRQSTEAYGHHPSLVAWVKGDSHRSFFRRAESTSRAISRADQSRPQIDPLPEVKSLTQLDALRRSRRLLNGYLVTGRDRELLAATSQAIRVSFSVRKSARRRDTQLIDVHLINDTEADLTDVLIETSASWANESRDWRWSSNASAASSAYAGTMPVPRKIEAEELQLSWTIDGRASGSVTRRVGSDGMILGIKS